MGRVRYRLFHCAKTPQLMVMQRNALVKQFIVRA